MIMYLFGDVLKVYVMVSCDYYNIIIMMYSLMFAVIQVMAKILIC